MVEQLARRIAQDKIRKHDKSPEMMELEKSLTETLGTRVVIENRPTGGRVLIEFFSSEDLSHIAEMLAAQQQAAFATIEASVQQEADGPAEMPIHPNTTQLSSLETAADQPLSVPTTAAAEEELYSVTNFTV
jgi:hypothetical protein